MTTPTVDPLTAIEDLLLKLTDRELLTLRGEIIPAEVSRREAIPFITGTIKKLRDQEILPAPVATASEPTKYTLWQDPQKDESKAALEGDLYFHEGTGRVYRSTVKGLNFDEPAINSPFWADVTDELFPPEPKAKDKDGKTETVWDTDETYALGDRVSYDDTLYEVIKAHKANASKTPDTASNLYKRV